jgi:hypothetical protein
MVLRNVPAPLNVEDAELWENITEHHILRYFAEIHRHAPGVLTYNVSNAYDTIIRKQTFTALAHTPTTTTATATADEGETNNNDDDDVDDDDTYAQDSSPTASASPLPQPLGQLELEYSQTIDYVVFGSSENVNEDVVSHQVFLSPFENDAQAYILDLIVVFDLDNWIELHDINAGPTNSPTSAPTVARPFTPADDNTDGDGLTNGAVWAISVSIVMAAILVVAFLFWDRHYQENLFKANHARDLFETMEYDNAGNAGDWRNPFGSLSQDDTPPPSQPTAAATVAPAVVSSSTQQNRRRPLHAMESSLSRQSRESQDTNQSTVVASTPPDARAIRTIPGSPSMSNVNGRGPQEHQQQDEDNINNDNGDAIEANLHENGRPTSVNTRMGGGGGTIRHSIFSTPSPHPRFDGRHVSVANTEITDLTFSEVGDRGSDVAELFTLPPIYDEPYMIHHDNDENPVHINPNLDNDQDGVVPWSSLHIPQGDAYGTIESAVESVRPGLGDIGFSQTQLMTGFEMQVEELE